MSYVDEQRERRLRASARRRHVIAFSAAIAVTLVRLGRGLPPLSQLPESIEQMRVRQDAPDEPVASTTPQGPVDSPQAEEPAGESDLALVWDELQAPDYVSVIGVSRRDVALEPGQVAYGDLDELGRATGAEACVTHDLMVRGVERPREDMSDLFPSGWGHNGEVKIELKDGTFYSGWFWNRSHLVAKSLGGAEDIRNLVTGTRMQNVSANDGAGGMAYTETIVRTWLEDHPDGFVRYAATPIYEGAEPVPRYVEVDVLSSDESLDMCVCVFNAAKGFGIDYSTGEFHAL